VAASWVVANGAVRSRALAPTVPFPASVTTMTNGAVRSPTLVPTVPFPAAVMTTHPLRTNSLMDTWAAVKAAGVAPEAAPAVVAFLTPANTVLDTWAVETIVVVASAVEVALEVYPGVDANGVECSSVEVAPLEAYPGVDTDGVERSAAVLPK